MSLFSSSTGPSAGPAVFLARVLCSRAPSHGVVASSGCRTRAIEKVRVRFPKTTDMPHEMEEHVAWKKNPQGIFTDLKGSSRLSDFSVAEIQTYRIILEHFFRACSRNMIKSLYKMFCSSIFLRLRRRAVVSLTVLKLLRISAGFCWSSSKQHLRAFCQHFPAFACILQETEQM